MILRICFIDLILKHVAAETAEAVFIYCNQIIMPLGCVLPSRRI